jgi:5-bromo-4-chloroindolyl phosphate hydrolysis protein
MLGPDEQATLGTTAPIKGVTILQREKNAEPGLLEVKKSIVVKDMILRNFARQNPGLEIVDRIYSIVENAECYSLRYDNLDQAVNLLEDAFG